MALVTRNLTNAGAGLTGPDGAPLAGIRVSFTLVTPSGSPTDAWDATTHERVGSVLEVTTDDAGEFAIELWPNARGNRSSAYQCKVHSPGFRDFIAPMIEGGGDYDWLQFMANGQAVTAQELTGLSAHLADPTDAHQASAIGGFSAAALATILSGFAVGANAAIVDTDSILAAFGKTQGQISARAPIASPTFTGSVGITGGSVAASAPALNVTQTWNNAAVTFTGALFDYTDTASAALSNAIDVKVGGTSVFKVGKNGSIAVGANPLSASFAINAPSLAINANQYQAGASGGFYWSDTGFFRDGAGVMAQRFTTTAQEQRIYETYVDSSNYSRLTAKTKLYNGVTMWSIGSEAAGTGTARQMVLDAAGTVVHLATLGVRRVAVNSTAIQSITDGDVTNGTASARWRTGYFGNITAAVTTSLPMLDLAQTWNNAAVMFTGMYVDITNTASAATSRVFDFRVGAASMLSLNTSGTLTANASIIAGGGLAATTANGFLQLGPNATAAVLYPGGTLGILEQRNAANAQTFRVYNTYTDASNYERGALVWNTNEFGVCVQNGGTGTARRLRLEAGAQIYFASGGTTVRWQMDGSGHFTALTDNTYDIGASGATRPRSVYLAGTAYPVGGVRTSSAGVFAFTNTGDPNGTIDTILRRGGAGLLDLQNGANAQRIRVANAWTDAANNELFEVGFDGSNNGIVRTVGAGTGTGRNLYLTAGGTLYFGSNATNARWNMTAGGLFAGTDNTYDIGALGASRPRNLYLGNDLSVDNRAAVGTTTHASAFLRIGASTTAKAHLDLLPGVDPTAPNNGNIWFDGTDIKLRAGGVTYTLTKV